MNVGFKLMRAVDFGTAMVRRRLYPIIAGTIVGYHMLYSYCSVIPACRVSQWTLFHVTVWHLRVLKLRKVGAT